MISYHHTAIAPGARFHQTNYPQLSEELTVIESKSADMPFIYKPGLLIAYARDHSMDEKWMDANPPFAHLLLSGTLPLHGMDQLFTRCRRQPLFRSGLESFIHDWFGNHHAHSMHTNQKFSYE